MRSRVTHVSHGSRDFLVEILHCEAFPKSSCLLPHIPDLSIIFGSHDSPDSMLSLFSATPTLVLAPNAAAPAMRMASPKMQMAQAPGAAMDTSYMQGRAVPTGGGIGMHPRAGGSSAPGRTLPSVEQVQVMLSSGRPRRRHRALARPGQHACQMRVYVEDGQLRPFSAVIETPAPDTVAIRNIGQVEFPLANVVAEASTRRHPKLSSSMTVQGGALRTYPFDPSVDSVQSSRPTAVNAASAAGSEQQQAGHRALHRGRPRPPLLRLPDDLAGNVVRCQHGPVEFPMTASVVPTRSTTPTLASSSVATTFA